MFQTSQTSQGKHFLLISVFLLAVFILAVAVWYAPVIFKGYAPYELATGFLLARNIYQSGFYSIENNLNITLSSNLIKDQGILSARGNKLTSIIYAKIFEFTGLPGPDDFVLLSIVIHALTLVIFTGLIIYLFDLKLALVFSLIYIFLPFNWQWPYRLGAYEFALFFLSLFFLFYLYGIRQKYNYIYLPLAGIFLALACLSIEALLLMAPFLLVFLWLKKQRNYLAYILIPLVILLAVFWLSDIQTNAYLELLTTQVTEETKSADFSIYGHLYPDPYTYHFEQKEFLAELQDKIANNQIDLMKKLDLLKELRNVGATEISLINRIRVGLAIAARHIFRFVSLEDMGGPFILFLILLGLYALKKENRYLYHFFIYWILSAIFLMSFVVLAWRNHLIDFNWAIALLISLGLLTLDKIVINYFQFQTKKAGIFSLVILLAVLYQLVLVDHIVLGKAYDSSHNLTVEAYAQEIKKLGLADYDVIAVNLEPGAMSNLNYLTNKSVVLFRSQTIENLLAKNKLNFAFGQFGVKYILGYSDELTLRIISQAEVLNIASNSLEPATPELSRNQGWLMNLIK